MDVGLFSLDALKFIRENIRDVVENSLKNWG